MEWVRDIIDGHWFLEAKLASYWVEKRDSGWGTEVSIMGLSAEHAHMIWLSSSKRAPRIWKRVHDAKKACEKHYKKMLEEELQKLKELK